MKSEVEKIVIECFEKELNIHLDKYEDIALKDLQLDSLGFISFIVNLENIFSITIPDEYLIVNELPDLITFSHIIDNLCKMEK